MREKTTGYFLSATGREFLAGIKAEIPLVIGGVPFGMIYGVLALNAGIPPGPAQAMSLVVFAGSAQFIIAQLVGQGVPAVVIILTGAIVNLRHALYSASVAPYLKRLSPGWKAVLAYMLTDETYAVTITHFREEDDNIPTHSAVEDLDSSHKHWFLLGAGLMEWSSWQASTAIGIFLGAQVPSSWSLDFTLALTFIGLVVTALRDWPSIAAALSAGVVAVLAFTLPFKLGLVLAALVGILVGLWSEKK